MNNYFMGQDGVSWFIGVVEDRADPKKAGRVRVRCLGYHNANIQEIPMEDLPWASVMMPVTAGANSGIGMSPHFLIEGTWVVGFFRDPAKQEPVIMGALPGVNSSTTTNFTIASSSVVGGDSQGVDSKILIQNIPQTFILILQTLTYLHRKYLIHILQGLLKMLTKNGLLHRVLHLNQRQLKLVLNILPIMSLKQSQDITLNSMIQKEMNEYTYITKWVRSLKSIVLVM